jgi:hypothetical protein
MGGANAAARRVAATARIVNRSTKDVLMSVREIIGRLTDAKRQLGQARTIGVQAAGTVAEAKAAVDSVLDSVQNKGLSDAIAVKAKAITDEFAGLEAQCKSLDAAIQRVQQIGSRR